MCNPKKVEATFALDAVTGMYRHSAILPGACSRNVLCAEFVIKVLGRAPAMLRATVSEEPMEGSFRISRGRMYEAPFDYLIHAHGRSQATCTMARLLLTDAFPDWTKLHVVLEDADEAKEDGR